jgi:hypothetical protein
LHRTCLAWHVGMRCQPHLWSLHFCVSRRCEHVLPPYSVATLMLRTRVADPDPQVRVQPDQAPHAFNEQSTGHACSLQGAIACHANSLHALPPPQLAEHSCPPTPHAPPAGCRSALRLRCFLPVPHDLVHVLYADHAPGAQSSGTFQHLLCPASPRVLYTRAESTASSVQERHPVFSNDAWVYCPLTQSEHCSMPSASWNLPAGQCKQCTSSDVAPMASMPNRPLLHGLHLLAPAAAAKWPAAQCWQYTLADAPLLALKRPARQSVHVLDAITAHDPGLHVTHWSATEAPGSALAVPEGHCLQSTAPSCAWNVPATHCSHVAMAAAL